MIIIKPIFKQYIFPKIFQTIDISKNPSMEVKRIRVLVTEIIKKLNDSNPVFMKDIFQFCLNKSHKKHNITLM